MKEFKPILGVIGFCTAVMIATGCIHAAVNTNPYRTETAICTETHLLETEDGNQWEVYDDLKLGEKYVVKFHNNHTKTIEDDIILYVQEG